jgi:hypothetical protein
LLKLLAVHLKSGCFQQKLTDDYATKRDREEGIETCHVLANQVPALEAWIDQNSAAGVDWVVIGDFNRRFEHPLEKSPIAREAGKTIAMFPELNDNDPPGAKLYRVTYNRRQIASCREGGPGSSQFIDHVIFGRFDAQSNRRDLVRAMADARTGAPRSRRALRSLCHWR